MVIIGDSDGDGDGEAELTLSMEVSSTTDSGREPADIPPDIMLLLFPSNVCRQGVIHAPVTLPTITFMFGCYQVICKPKSVVPKVDHIF